MLTTDPSAIEQSIQRAIDSVQGVAGWISDRELQFLTMLAACPSADGDILELGTFAGKSTIALAIGAEHQPASRFVSVDIESHASAHVNLEQRQLESSVELVIADSNQFSKQWSGPIRLLWHDGANELEVVEADLNALIPFLADDAIIAMHDVLNPSGYRIRCFCERVLESNQFGAAGIVGSIGWAQRTDDPNKLRATAANRQRLSRRLRPLYPYHNFHGPVRLADKLAYKIKRSRVPHHGIGVSSWLRQISS